MVFIFILDNWLLKNLSVNRTKRSNTLKQFVSNLATNCFSVFEHFVGLAFKWLTFELRTKT